MNLAEQTRWLLKQYKLRPLDEQGQNFLIDDKVLGQIIEAAELDKADKILEIGAGLGSLTSRLAAAAGAVVSFETDQRLRPVLNKLAAVNQNLHLVFQDFLTSDWTMISKQLSLTGDQIYKIVANIPYYATGSIIEKILAWPQLPSLIILMVQKEVAQRITAKPGAYSKLGLAVQFRGQPEIRAIVKRQSFWPAPAVDSALLKIADLKAWPYKVDERSVWQLIRIGFSSRRKTLLNNLAAGLQQDKKYIAKWFDKIELPQQIRAQDLKIEDWIALTSQRPKF